MTRIMVLSYMHINHINLYLKPIIGISNLFEPSKLIIHFDLRKIYRYINLVFRAVFFLLHLNLNSIKIINKLR